MAIDQQLVDFFPHTVTITPKSSINNYGEDVHGGTPRTVAAYVEPRFQLNGGNQVDELTQPVRAFINDTTLEQWTGSASIDVLVRWPVGNAEVILTAELLYTAGFVAAIAGLQFTGAALTASSYREEFLDGTLGELRESLAVLDGHRLRRVVLYENQPLVRVIRVDSTGCVRE